MMKIVGGAKYHIKLYEEPCVIDNHNKRFSQILTFTGVELIWSIVSAGMPDVYLTKTAKRSRKEEIEFKIKLFETFVASSWAGELSFDLLRKTYLDATEIGAINYWIGMVLVTVLGQKKYGYEFMVHLSKLRWFNSLTIYLDRYNFITAYGNLSFKSPDLLAINVSNNTFGVFESKGYSRYSKMAMERGFIQAKSIGRINGNPPQNSLVVMVLTGGNEISIIEKDPEGENCEIDFNLDFLYLYHFLPIAELITELGAERRGDRTRADLRYGDDCYSISIPSDLYEEFLPIVMSDEEWLPDESAVEVLFSEKRFSRLISEKSEERILRVEEN